MKNQHDGELCRFHIPHVFYRGWADFLSLCHSAATRHDGAFLECHFNAGGYFK